MKTALVVGCASNVWEDVKAAQALTTFDAVYCVKQIGIYWPTAFQVWATLHPETMDASEAERAAKGFPGGYEIVAPLSGELGEHGASGRVARRVSFRWPGMNSSAASGIYGAKVALGDGFDRVVLAGIPMIKHGIGHFLPGTLNKKGRERTRTQWIECDQFDVGLENATPFMRGKVKSMSGITKQILGAPSAEWLSA